VNQAVEQWCEATRQKREGQERLWAELARAVEQMVRQQAEEQRHEATGALLDALGVTIEDR
jgi:hypothetical protein